MKISKQIYFVLLSIMLVLSISYFIFNSRTEFTGLVVNDIQKPDNNIPQVTREMALNSINEAETVIERMQKNGFSITYVDDILIEAKRVLQQVDYAEILRGNLKADKDKKNEAENALKLIDWKSLTYADVIKNTEEIKKRETEAYLIIDNLYVLKNKISEESGKLNSLGLYSNGGASDLSKTQKFFRDAQTAFKEDRYDEAKNLLEKSSAELESETSKASILAGLGKGLIGFFQQFWAYILFIIALMGLSLVFSFNKLNKKMLKKNIKKIKMEKNVLNKLMKKTQLERFKYNKISGLVYNIRMKKYEEKLEKIKQELPVLEAKLKKLK